MEDPNRLTIPFWMNLENTFNSPINNPNNFNTGLLTIDCLICGQQLTCSQITVYSKDEEKWANNFCDVFNMNFPDAHYIVRSSYYCGGCNETLRKIAATCSQIDKLKSDLELMKGACENQIRWAKSNVTFANVHNQCYSRETIFQYLDGNRHRSNQIQQISLGSISASAPNVSSSCSISVPTPRTNVSVNVNNPVGNSDEILQQTTITQTISTSPVPVVTAPVTEGVEEQNQDSPSTEQMEDTISTHYSDDDEFAHMESPEVTDRDKHKIDTKLKFDTKCEIGGILALQSEADISAQIKRESKLLLKKKEETPDSDTRNSQEGQDQYQDGRINSADTDVDESEKIPRIVISRRKKTGKQTQSENGVKIKRCSRNVPKAKGLQQLLEKKRKLSLKIKKASKRKSKRNKQTSSDSESYSETDSDSQEGLDLKDPDFDVSDVLYLSMPKEKANGSSLRTSKRSTVSTDNRTTNATASYSPTIFSNRDKDEYTALRKKYKASIIKYQVRDFSIPVERIPDLDESDDETDGRRRGCPIVDCTSVFYKKFKLIEHIKVTHQGLQYPYECTICHKRYVGRLDFKDHGNTHTGLKPYNCTQCEMKFSTKSKLNEHIRNIHEEKKFQCDQCGKCYSSKYNCELHLKSHSGERPYTCEICGKSFKQKYDLRNHQTRHPELNLIPFKCEFCQKVFANIHSLKVHTLAHTGDSPFQCEICGYKAAFEATMKVHKLKHKTGTDYECDICNKKLKNELILANHKKFWCKERNEAVCKICGKVFKNHIVLKQHEKVHNRTDKTFLCSECGMSFFWSKNLRRHSKTCHKKTSLSLSSDNFNLNLNPSHSHLSLTGMPGIQSLGQDPPIL